MQPEKDILMQQRPDRRLLSNVPDAEGIRSNSDRRGHNESSIADRVKKNIEENHSGIRYLVDYPVSVTARGFGGKLNAKAKDISSSGILLQLQKEDADKISVGDTIKLDFEITPGSMPEGYESDVKMEAYCMRLCNDEEGFPCVGAQFSESLLQESVVVFL